MVIGTTLLRNGGATYFSPVFFRGGQAAVFSVELLVLTGTSFTIVVQHKNMADTAWTSAGTFGALVAIGIETLDLSGLKEQIRFTYVVVGPNNYDAAHFNMLAPAWRP